MPTDPAAKRVLDRFAALASERGTTENVWQQIADHELGRRNFVSKQTPGQKRQQRIYDDSSKVSGQLLAGAMHSLLTSPAAPWFELRFEDDTLNEEPEATRWLAAAQHRIYTAMQRPKANFHGQLA